MTYPTSHPLDKLIGPAQLCSREDFYLVGLALRMAAHAQSLGACSKQYEKEYTILRKKAQKFMDRYGLDPQDFHQP